MAKYLIKRLLHGIVSIIIVIFIVMLLIYTCMDRTLIFASDSQYTKLAGNQKIVYQYQKWENYGYLDYITYADYLESITNNGEIDEDTRAEAVQIGRKPENDSAVTKEYVDKFTDYYTSRGYHVTRLNALVISGSLANGGTQQLFAYKDINIFVRLWNFITGFIHVDNIHYVKEDIEDRGIHFTWHDPAYGGDTFAPAIMGTGTQHKYLVYFDSKFPFIHQNLVSLRLGTSYTINKGNDVWNTMTDTQGSYVYNETTFPTGVTERSAYDIHSATYVAGSRNASDVNQERFTDDYTNLQTNKNGMSRMGYSFVIGLISVVIAYMLGLPIGILLARKKGKLADILGAIYIVFIIAVPSLAYIFMFKAIGNFMGLPTTFSVTSPTALMYILPIVSLALPSIGGLMKWMRRYMIDQSNADYVKFARSGGLSEGEIFNKHIMRNAVIPILHGIPGSILGSLTGAIITERVYVVPGVGNVLTNAINKYDNGVIVGVTLFYAVLSVLSLILGDIMMALADPRISFSSKER